MQVGTVRSTTLWQVSRQEQLDKGPSRTPCPDFSKSRDLLVDRFLFFFFLILYPSHCTSNEQLKITVHEIAVFHYEYFEVAWLAGLWITKL